MAVVDQPPLLSAVSSEFDISGEHLVRRLVTQPTASSDPGIVAETMVRRVDDGVGLDSWWRSYFAGHRPRRKDGMPSPKITTVELFCGPGGLGLGFDQAAMELGLETNVAAIVDQDAGAVGVYSRNRDVGIRTSESVTTLVDHQLRGKRAKARYVGEPLLLDPKWRELIGNVDVVLAGPPCQGHSNLNNQTRRIDLRNELYLTVPAIAIALNAPMVVIENVPAVVHDKIGVVESTTTLLEAAGYAVQQGVLHAAKIGWPQTRSRFFLVARKGVAPLALEDVESGLSSTSRSATWAFDGIDAGARPDFMSALPDFSQENIERIDWLFENDAYDLPNEWRPDCHKDGTTYTSVYGRMKPDRPAQTVTTGFFTPGRGRYIHPTERRAINASEAARLQGFPDTYDFHPREGETPSRAQLAKWIGDAVPMPLGYAAGIAVLGGGAL